MMGKILKSVRFEVLARDGFRCRYCGASPHTGAVLHVDHVRSLYRGGGSDLSNLVTACADCNHGKSDRALTIAPEGFALGPDRRPARMKRIRGAAKTDPSRHELDTGEIDDLDELDDGCQLALVWCLTHQKYEWHYLPLDLISSGAVITRVTTKGWRG